MSGIDGDWSKPAAMAIPKEGYFELERGRYGPLFPRTPACYGFSIIAKVKEGREETVRAYGKTIEETIANSPEALAPLRLHYLRWVLFDVGSGCTSSTWASSTPTSISTPRIQSSIPAYHLSHKGIFDTDFDKYTEDAVALFSATGITTVFTNLEGFPEDWKENPEAFIKFVREHQCPELPGIRRVPVRHGRRDQEGAAAEGGLLRHARPDAVPMLEFDDIQHILLTRTPAITGRYEFLSFDTPAGGRAWLTELLDKVQSAADAQATVDELGSLGHVGVHVEWPSRARRARGVAGHLSRRVPRGDGGPRGHPRRHRRGRSRTLGRRPGR